MDFRKIIYRVYQKTLNPREKDKSLNLGNPYETYFMDLSDKQLPYFNSPGSFLSNLYDLLLFELICVHDWSSKMEEIGPFYTILLCDVWFCNHTIPFHSRGLLARILTYNPNESQKQIRTQ